MFMIAVLFELWKKASTQPLIKNPNMKQMALEETIFSDYESPLNKHLRPNSQRIRKEVPCSTTEIFQDIFEYISQYIFQVEYFELDGFKYNVYMLL